MYVSVKGKFIFFLLCILKKECRYGLSKIGNGHRKLSFILCVQLNLGMKLLTVAFVWFLMQTCTEHRGGRGGVQA